MSPPAGETTLARHQLSACRLSSPSSTATMMRRPAAEAATAAVSISTQESEDAASTRSGDERLLQGVREVRTILTEN